MYRKELRVWFWTITLELSIKLNLPVETYSKQHSVGV